jgi:hypothetical protein
MTETPLFLVVESQRGVKDDRWQQGVEEEGGGELGEGVLLLDNDIFGQIKGKLKQDGRDKCTENYPISSSRQFC